MSAELLLRVVTDGSGALHFTAEDGRVFQVCAGCQEEMALVPSRYCPACAALDARLEAARLKTAAQKMEEHRHAQERFRALSAAQVQELAQEELVHRQAEAQATWQAIRHEGCGDRWARRAMEYAGLGVVVLAAGWGGGWLVWSLARLAVRVLLTISQG